MSIRRLRRTALVVAATATLGAGAAAGLPSAAGGRITAKAAHPSTVDAYARWAGTVRVRDGRNAYRGAAPRIALQQGSVVALSATSRVSAGVFRGSVMVAKPGRWQVSVRVGRARFPAGAVTVRPALTNAMDVAVQPDGQLLVGDFDNYVFRGAPGGRVTVVAGNGGQGASGDGGPATAAAVGFPVEVAVDPRGGFAIVSVERDIRHVAPDGTISTVASLEQPTAHAYDAAGNLFVSELGGRVRRIDAATGAVTTYAGVGGEGFGGDGGTATAAQLNRPHGLVVDASGVLYFCDTFNNRIRRVEPATQVITTVAAELGSPNDLALGPDGALYVSEFSNNRISRVTTAGAVSKVVDAPGTNSVAVDAQGRIYFTERTAPRVRRFDPATGRVTTVLGR